MTTDNWEAVERCEVCRATKFRRLGEVSDRLYRTTGRFTLVRCVGCGLTFINPRPTMKEIGLFYPTEYTEYQAPLTPRLRRWEEDKGRPGAKMGPWRRLVAFINERMSYRMIPPYQGEGRLLDVGCASGEFLDKMRLLGWQTYGVERSPAAAEIACRNGHRVLVSDIENGLPIPEASFDLVYCWHVLEHLHSPLRALREMARLLAPGGRLVLAVPNFGSFQAKLFGRFWSKLEPPRHLFHFDKNTLRALLRHGGFEPQSMTTRTGATSYCRSFRLLINAVLGTRFMRDPAAAVFLFEIPVFIASLFNNLGLGSDIRVVCRKA
ncbi:MAG: class I SAM-dependent methyltransferase [Myxococcales bacterium]|nr:class I SAM-dependent methyltransferase [Myxococcales bacterium]